MKDLHLRICHLYPELMNLYGDRGNVIALYRRCKWRGIEVTVDAVSIGESFGPHDYDIIFVGGGQDRQQELVWKDLQDRREILSEAAENDVVMLAVCGGYQLFGRYYWTCSGEIPGIGIFDVHTVAGDTRIIGNTVITSHYLEGEGEISTLVGFENHAGRTYLANGTEPLGQVLMGGGNDGESKTEGCVYRNCFGTYLHGSLLPKNPHLADLLLSRAISRQCEDAELEPLDDNVEWAAHRAALSRSGIKRLA